MANEKIIRSKEDNLDLMEKAPVKKAILTLAIPTVLGTIVQLIYNLTDTYFIGLMDDPNQLAAISLAFPVAMLIQALGNIFGLGAPAYISVKLGEQNMDSAKRASATAFYTTIGVGVLMTLFFALFLEKLLPVIGTSPDTYQLTKEYLQVIGWFSIILVLQIVLPGLLRSEGATKQSVIGMLIGNIINIILDPIFILVFNMGVAGAAWATIIGNAISVCYYLFYFAKCKGVLTIALSWFKPTWQLYKNMFKIGIPATISQVLMSVVGVVQNNVAAGYGDYVITAFGVASKAFMVAIMIAIGFSQGLQPFAGYNYGAGNYRRMTAGVKTSMLYGTIICIFVAILFGVFPRPFMAAFTSSDLIIDTGVEMMHALLWCIPLISIQMTLVVVLQSTGQAIKACILLLSRQWLLYVPVLFILNHLFQLHGFMYAQPVADYGTTILALLFTVPFLRKLHKMEEEQERQEAAVVPGQG